LTRALLEIEEPLLAANDQESSNSSEDTDYGNDDPPNAAVDLSSHAALKRLVSSQSQTTFGIFNGVMEPVDG
jgi:hypothetical protein